MQELFLQLAVVVLGVMEQRQAAFARCLFEHCRVGLFPAINYSQSRHYFLWFVAQVRAGEGTAFCAKDWKVVRHEVDFVLWKVLGSESLETVSVLSLWKLITSSLIDAKAVSITIRQLWTI